MLNSLSLHYETLVPSAPVNEDAATIRLSLTPSATDTAQYVDSQTERLAFTPSGTDTLGGGTYTDSATIPLAFTVTYVDAAIFVDSGTRVLALTGSVTEFKESTDAATENFRFTIEGHDCYAIATPTYDVNVFLRWNMQTPFATWEVGSIATRWNCFVVGTSLDIPC